MNFLDDDFLLTTDLAQELFHNHAESMPVVDYHCHLYPQEICEDPNFPDIVAAWLTDGNNYGDHYKWRLERANGVPEELITGNGDPWDKFYAYAETMEKAIGSPVYLWTHLELRRYFGIEEPLTRKTAKAIYEECNEKLKGPEFSRRGLLRRMRVDTVCTTDDPIDDLHYHKQFAKEGETFQMLPAMRPDKAYNINQPSFEVWVEKLEEITGNKVTSFSALMDGIEERVAYFHEHGGRLADQGADHLTYVEATEAELDVIVDKARAGKELSALEVAQYQTAFILNLMRIYAAKGWTMQLHMNCVRNINTRLFTSIGADTGGDAIADHQVTEALMRLLDKANESNDIPKLIVYSLNPNDYMTIATVMGAFQGDIRQKLSLGNAWWFNDTRTGIRKQLEVQAETSLLGNAVGMTTDSRSFLSYTRHEFFRRILCELLGEWASRGEIPNDVDYLAPIVEDISFNNAKALFN